jgi:hypothetical protein
MLYAPTGAPSDKTVDRAIRFVTALLDCTLYSSLPTHLRPLYLYLDSHRTIANTRGSPFIVATKTAITSNSDS